MESLEVDEHGTLLSHCINFENRHCRLVALWKNQPTLFSELLTLDPKGKSRVFLEKVPLKPGVRIEGRLAADVPRPIKNGRVICQIQEVEEGEFRPCWTWLDQTKINEDGTFVLDSVPQGAPLQLIAICDGWVSSNPTKGELAVHYPRQVKDYDPNRSNVYPHLVPTDKPNTLSIGMTKTSQIKVKVIGSDEKPVPGILAYAICQQSWFPHQNQTLGYGIYDFQLILNRQHFQHQGKLRAAPFSKTTNDTGECNLKGIPKRNTERIFVIGPDGFTRLAKKSVDMNKGNQSITIKLDKTSEEVNQLK